jgi:hypothetical protein
VSVLWLFDVTVFDHLFKAFRVDVSVDVVSVKFGSFKDFCLESERNIIF